MQFFRCSVFLIARLIAARSPDRFGLRESSIANIFLYNAAKTLSTVLQRDHLLESCKLFDILIIGIQVNYRCVATDK